MSRPVVVKARIGGVRPDGTIKVAVDPKHGITMLTVRGPQGGLHSITIVSTDELKAALA